MLGRMIFAAMAVLGGAVVVGTPAMGGTPGCPEAGLVVGETKISQTAGGFTGTLDFQDAFGVSTASLGDLDSDGVVDLAVGATGDDDGGMDRGAVYILFMNASGTVRAQQKLSSTVGGLTGALDNFDQFGASLAFLGDLDGDGVPDLAVGTPFDDDGGFDRGAVYILFLNANGTVRARQKISSAVGGFTGLLDNFDAFGFSVASLGDLDGDGVTDLAVGAEGDDDGGSGRGAVYILFLNTNGTVRAQQKISSTLGGFGGALDDSDVFGSSLASLGDLDGDGVRDLAVGARFDDDEGLDRGAVYILLMNGNGTVRAQQKISSTTGAFTGPLDDSDAFGASTAPLGDLDGDGVVDLAVGAFGDDDGGPNRGAIYILFMNANGTVRAEKKISSTVGGFVGPLQNSVQFGFSMALLGDLGGNGNTDIAVGAVFDGLRGATWILAVDGCAVPACPGDADGDNMVGLSDIAVLISFWSSIVPPAPATLDLDGDGSIGLGDIAAVIGNWGASCP
jgi:hypothetical protein